MAQCPTPRLQIMARSCELDRLKAANAYCCDPDITMLRWHRCMLQPSLLPP